METGTRSQALIISRTVAITALTPPAATVIKFRKLLIHAVHDRFSKRHADEVVTVQVIGKFCPIDVFTILDTVWVGSTVRYVAVPR